MGKLDWMSENRQTMMRDPKVRKDAHEHAQNINEQNAKKLRYGELSIKESDKEKERQKEEEEVKRWNCICEGKCEGKDEQAKQERDNTDSIRFYKAKSEQLKAIAARLALQSGVDMSHIAKLDEASGGLPKG